MNIHGSNTDVRKMFTITIRVPYSYRSLGNLVVSREVPCLDGLSRCSRKNKAILRWVFQPIPRPVRFTWDLIYDSGSPTPLKGCVVRVAVHPRCSRPSPVRFTAHCTDTHCPHREEVRLTLYINLMSELVPNLPLLEWAVFPSVSNMQTCFSWVI